MKRDIVYVKNEESALVNCCGQFVYEVCVFVHFRGIYNMANSKFFYSDKELNIVPILKISPYIEVQCYLYSAPLKWLLNNGFNLYIKPEKKKRIKKKENEQKTVSN